MLAVAAVPGVAWSEVRVDVVFVHGPAVIAVTLTVTVHVSPGDRAAPVSEIAPPPATAAGVPEQVVDSPFGVDTTKPAGNISLKPTPVRVKF